MRIGVTAALDVHKTPHTRSFLRGVALANNMLPQIARCPQHFFDDEASGPGGARAAEYLLSQGVDLVIGHFASDSAAAAIELYEQRGIPVLLPASTYSGLTEGRRCAFRLCLSDRALAKALLQHLRRKRIPSLHALADFSLHGKRQMVEIVELAPSYGIAIVDSRDNAGIVVYCGRLGTSAEYLAAARADGYRGPLFFTDDAASPQLASAHADPGEVYAISFPSDHANQQAAALERNHRHWYGEPPAIYVLETVSAFYVAQALLARGGDPIAALNAGEIATPAGPMRFVDGENVSARYAIWSVEARGTMVPLAA